MSSFILILILFIFPSILLLICGYLHFKNHFQIIVKCNKLFRTAFDKANSKSNSNDHDIHMHIPPGHCNQDSNTSNKHLMPSSHPIHVSQSSHLSEISTFSTSYKEQQKYSFKKLKKCLNSFKMIKPKDNDWNFFPLSFLFHVLILFSLTLIISVKYKYTYSIANASCSFTSPLSLSNSVDDIIVYCLLIINIWESLLNFFRYWTTRQCSLLIVDNTYTLYLYFSSYLSLFLILCIVQFHFVYWLFPIIIMIHITFNIFCIIQFSHILLIQYNTISEGDRKTLAIVNDNMVSSVKIMMAVSSISCIMNTCILSLIISCYDMDIILYIPLIHSVSSFIFSFNFVRNRSSMKHCFIQIQKIPILKKFVIIGHSDNNNNENTSNTVIDVDKLRINLQLNPILHAKSKITPQPPNTPEISISNHDEMDENVLADQHKLTVHPIQQSSDDIDNANAMDMDIVLEEPVPQNIVSTPSTSVVNISNNPDESPDNDITQHNEAPAYISLTPLFRSTSKLLNKNSKTSRSEPSSPLINNRQIQKHRKQSNKFSKTPQFAARLGFTPSPAFLQLNPRNWVKTLSLNIGLTKSEEDHKIYTVVHPKHKKQSQSEVLQKPRIAEFVTHMTSFKDNKTLTEHHLSVFKADIESNRFSIIGNIDDMIIKGTEMDNKSVDEEDVVIDSVRMEARLDNDAFVISADLVQEIEINTTDDLQQMRNHKNTRELLSFEKWDVFCSMLPSDEPRLQASTSDKQIQLQCDTKRISNTAKEFDSRRSSSMMNTNDFGKAIFELKALNMQHIQEEDMSSSEDIVSNRKNEEILAMLQLMVQHGFYSKNALNSVEQLRKYNVNNSDLAPFHK